MSFRFLCAFAMVCPLLTSACGGTEPAPSINAASSSSSSGAAGMGGAGGNGGAGGMGGQGGVAMDDAILCKALDAADTPESLVAGADAMSAPWMVAPDIMYDVTIPASGGFIALKTTTMHVTFAVYAQGDQFFDILLEGTSVGETIDDVACNGSIFRRYEHHSHNPSTFVVAFPPAPTNQRILFYHLL